MANLEQTESAIAGFTANRGLLFGIHEAEEFKVGGVGRDVGEVMFDPARHDAGAINPLSIWESVLGEPHVRVVVPERPLHINVIAHHRSSGKSDFYQMNAARQRLAGELSNAISESLPGITDRSWSYAIGESAVAGEDADVEVIGTNGDPLVEANTIAELCQGGLTFVISDFLALPLEQAKCPTTVAVKANHSYDLEIPAGFHSLPTNIQGGEVNTDKPRKLARVNRAQQEQHDQAVARLEAAGIAVAQVLFNWTDYPLSGFDIEAADQGIAGAISGLKAQAEK
jgi:hypothetical protein